MLSLRICQRRLISAQYQGTRAASTVSSTSSTPTRDCDIVIIGGGITGLALAARLASSPSTAHLRTSLIETGSLSKIENWEPSVSGASGDWTNRVSSVTKENSTWLEEIGAWDLLEKSRMGPIEEMQVWDSVTPSRLTLPSPSGQYMSTLVENQNIQRALLRLIRDSSTPSTTQSSSPSLAAPGITLIDNTKVASVTRAAGTEGSQDDYPLVSLTPVVGNPFAPIDPALPPPPITSILRTKLLVGADGLNSPVRAFTQTQTDGYMYNIHTVVSVLTHEAYPTYPSVPPRTAFQRYLSSGPLAFLPLGNETASLAWHTSPEIAKVLKSLDNEALVLLINACFRLPDHAVNHINDTLIQSSREGTIPTFESLQSQIALIEQSSCIQPYTCQSILYPPPAGTIPPPDSFEYPPIILSTQPKSTGAFPLRYAHAREYVTPRTALIGDAAHVVHPQAGMGMNLGLLDVRSLHQVISNALSVGGDIGSLVQLQEYQKERFMENQKVLMGTDLLFRMYQTKFGPLRWARSVGVDVLEQLDGVKSFIMDQSGSNTTKGSMTVLGGTKSGWMPDTSAFDTLTSGFTSLAGPLFSKKFTPSSIQSKFLPDTDKFLTEFHHGMPKVLNTALGGAFTVAQGVKGALDGAQNALGKK